MLEILRKPTAITKVVELILGIINISIILNSDILCLYKSQLHLALISIGGYLVICPTIFVTYLIAGARAQKPYMEAIFVVIGSVLHLAVAVCFIDHPYCNVTDAKGRTVAVGVIAVFSTIAFIADSILIILALVRGTA